MNKLSRFVKNRMLAYPRSCKTRVDVLLHAYLCSGNGVRWTVEGMLFDSDDRERRKIVRADAVEVQKKHLQTLNEMRDRIRSAVPEADLDQWYATALVDYNEKSAREHADLDYVEANINTLASTVDLTIVLIYDDVPFAQTELFDRSNPIYYGSRWETPEIIIRGLVGPFPLTIAKMPVRVESSFFDGAIEVLDIILRSTPESEDKTGLIDYRATLFAVHERY